MAQIFPDGPQESYTQLPSTNHSDDYVHVFSVDSNGLRSNVPNNGGFTQDAYAFENDPSPVVFIDGTVACHHKLPCTVTHVRLSAVVPGDTAYGYNVNQLITFDLSRGLGIASAQDLSKGYDALTLLAIALQGTIVKHEGFDIPCRDVKV